MAEIQSCKKSQMFRKCPFSPWFLVAGFTLLDAVEVRYLLLLETTGVLQLGPKILRVHLYAVVESQPAWEYKYWPFFIDHHQCNWTETIIVTWRDAFCAKKKFKFFFLTVTVFERKIELSKINFFFLNNYKFQRRDPILNRIIFFFLQLQCLIEKSNSLK